MRIHQKKIFDRLGIPHFVSLQAPSDKLKPAKQIMLRKLDSLKSIFPLKEGLEISLPDAEIELLTTLLRFTNNSKEKSK